MSIDQAIEDAEDKIRKILIDLESDTGMTVADVIVDTRNFAYLATEIHMVEPQR